MHVDWGYDVVSCDRPGTPASIGYATRAVQRWGDVETRDGPDNGRSRAWASARPGLQTTTIVERFDNRRFFDFYVDGLTRPVPVSASPELRQQPK
jgi:hypothetical protein